MIRIVICEDEVKQQDLLKDYLKKILKENSYEVLTYSCGEELINDYPKDIDIFLLDIQMNNITGMDVARDIRENYDRNVEIIFITSLIEYIQEGYEVRAYRYLLKPVKYDDLKKHMLTCIGEIGDRNKYLVFNEKNNITKVKVNDITYIEIQKKDITIHTIKENYSIKGTMDIIEKEIDNMNFFRCHKSFLVNLEYVESIKQYVAILENKEEVPISRHRFKDTKNKFYKLMGDKL